MNVARWTPLPFKSFLLELRGLGVLDVVGDVAIAILGAGIEIQQFLGRFRVRQVGDDFLRTSEPRGYLQLTADVCKCILERVGVPHSDAVTTLEALDGLARE